MRVWRCRRQLPFVACEVACNGCSLNLSGGTATVEGGDAVAGGQWADAPSDLSAGYRDTTAHAVAGGYRVSGRWPFGSGIQHSAWVYGNCRVFDGDTPRLGPGDVPEMRFMLIPANQCEIHDTWHVSGLRATGSNDMEFTELSIPREHTGSVFTERPVQPGPLYLFPLFGLLSVAIAAVTLGNLHNVAGTIKKG